MFVYAALADNINGVIYSDLSGRFPVESYWGMQYIFIAYIYDENVILMRPMKNWTDACMVSVFKDIYEYSKERKCKPKLQVIDNECSKAVQKFIKEQEVPIQLVEPGKNRVNAEEIGVKTGKYYLISSLAMVYKSIPLQLWCQYIPQIEMTLNMPQQFRQDPTISAYEALNGPFDYNKTPLVPLG